MLWLKLLIGNKNHQNVLFNVHCVFFTKSKAPSKHLSSPDLDIYIARRKWEPGLRNLFPYRAKLLPRAL